MIRIILAIVATANLYAAYIFFISPEIIAYIYRIPPLDNVHSFLTMIIGALLSVFGLGAILAFFRPRKYGSIIIMLLLMHFMIFLIDVVVLARGQMPWKAVVPEMVYFLIISTALVRWYPVEVQSGKWTNLRQGYGRQEVENEKDKTENKEVESSKSEGEQKAEEPYDQLPHS